MSTTHKCPHDHCTVQCPGSRLACWEHWYRVSPQTRRELLAEYTGNGITDEYMELRERAVAEMNRG